MAVALGVADRLSKQLRSCNARDAQDPLSLCLFIAGIAMEMACVQYSESVA